MRAPTAAELWALKWRKSMHRLLLLLAALAAVVPALSQVTARQGTAQDTGQPDSVIVESPMVVDVTIPAWKPGVRDRPTVWTSKETERFVCDKARVKQLRVTRSPRPLEMRVGPGMHPWTKGAFMELEVTPTLTTEWYRQDVDLTITLFEADGKTVLGTKFWDDLTIGKETAASAIGVWGSSSSKSPALVVGLSEEMVKRFEVEGLKAKIVVNIQ
jgi:hypothetical protein